VKIDRFDVIGIRNLWSVGVPKSTTLSVRQRERAVVVFSKQCYFSRNL